MPGDKALDYVLYRVTTPRIACYTIEFLCVLAALWRLSILPLFVVGLFEFLYSTLIDSGSPCDQLPVLVLNHHDPYLNGYALGTQCTKEIGIVINKLAAFGPRVSTKNLKISQRYMRELTGLSDATKISVDTFLRAHLMAEKIGCTTIMRDGVFLRNLDWFPLDLAKYSVVVHYRSIGMQMLTVPGIIAGPTMWSSDRIASVNVSPNKNVIDPQGLPILFHFRDLFETLLNQEDPAALLEIPMSRTSYHFNYQHGSRQMTIEFDRPQPKISLTHESLTVLNFNRNGDSRFNSYHRKSVLDKHADTRDLFEILASVETWITCHSVVANESYVRIRIANGYAASRGYEFALWRK
jgi:hypothetical protein